MLTNYIRKGEKMELKKDRWYDENGNSWSSKIETEESAQKKSESLINCSYCSDCSDCRDCRYCRYCRNCINSINCSDCSDCSDYKINPQRYVSDFIGSRKSQTYVYWINKEDMQIICGCFKGNLIEFKEKVEKTHANNEQYLNEYRKLIKQIEFLIEE